MIFAFFIKLIWLRVGVLNRTGAEIGYQFEKNAIKSFFSIEKINKIPQVPSSAGWALPPVLSAPDKTLCNEAAEKETDTR